MLIVLVWFIIRSKTFIIRNKKVTVESLPGPDDILPTTIIHLFGILSKNDAEEKQCHFCFKAI